MFRMPWPPVFCSPLTESRESHDLERESVGRSHESYRYRGHAVGARRGRGSPGKRVPSRPGRRGAGVSGVTCSSWPAPEPCSGRTSRSTPSALSPPDGAARRAARGSRLVRRPFRRWEVLEFMIELADAVPAGAPTRTRSTWPRPGRPRTTITARVSRSLDTRTTRDPGSGSTCLPTMTSLVRRAIGRLYPRRGRDRGVGEHPASRIGSAAATTLAGAEAQRGPTRRVGAAGQSARLAQRGDNAATMASSATRFGPSNAPGSARVCWAGRTAARALASGEGRDHRPARR